MHRHEEEGKKKSSYDDGGCDGQYIVDGTAPSGDRRPGGTRESSYRLDTLNPDRCPSRDLWWGAPSMLVTLQRDTCFSPLLVAESNDLLDT